MRVTTSRAQHDSEQECSNSTNGLSIIANDWQLVFRPSGRVHAFPNVIPAKAGIQETGEDGRACGRGVGLANNSPTGRDGQGGGVSESYKAA